MLTIPFMSNLLTHIAIAQSGFVSRAGENGFAKQKFFWLFPRAQWSVRKDVARRKATNLPAKLRQV
jgi:hypothetical protein